MRSNMWKRNEQAEAKLVPEEIAEIISEGISEKKVNRKIKKNFWRNCWRIPGEFLKEFWKKSLEQIEENLWIFFEYEFLEKKVMWKAVLKRITEKSIGRVQSGDLR